MGAIRFLEKQIHVAAKGSLAASLYSSMLEQNQLLWKECFYLVHQHEAFLISSLWMRYSLQSRKLISALGLGGHRDGRCGFTALFSCQESTDGHRERKCQK